MIILIISLLLGLLLLFLYCALVLAKYADEEINSDYYKKI